MVLVASNGWLGSKEKYSSIAYSPAWGGRCVGGWLGFVFYFGIKSTWQCRRSSSEPEGSLTLA